MDNYSNNVDFDNRIINGNGRNNSIYNNDDTRLYSPYQYRTLIMNSRERDRTIWDNAHTFQVNLDEPIRFVRSIKLIDFICNLERRYLIHTYNNTYEISTDSGATFTSYTMNVGDYDIALYGNDAQGSIAATIHEEFARVLTANAPNTTTAQLYRHSDKIALTVDIGSYIIRFPTSSTNKDSLAYVLGFKPDTNYIISVNENVAPYRVNYVKSSIAVININNNEFDVIKSNLSNKTNQTYGIVNIDKDYNKYKAGTPIVKYFINPLNYLDKLKIEITDIYGNAYDFHDSDLILTFLIEYENQLN